MKQILNVPRIITLSLDSLMSEIYDVILKYFK